MKLTMFATFRIAGILKNIKCRESYNYVEKVHILFSLLQMSSLQSIIQLIGSTSVCMFVSATTV